MTANRRIFLNAIATYGRSVYALVVGLFCGRWTLMALGATDYGLSGLVGGLTGMVSFFNGLLAFAVGRFYAVSIGAAMKDGNAANGLDECRKWFNTALLLHTVIPSILVVIGYPIGVWAVERFLTVPPDRVCACIWVWRFTCASCFVGMFNVPFGAMYGAKQEIAELTIYGFATTTINAFFQYYMVTHPGVWLVKYSLFTCALGILPSLIISVRAVMKYPECRLVVAYLWSKDRIKRIAIYAFSRFWSAFAGMFFAQGRAILVNKYMGPAYNAAMAIGNTVAGHALTLSSSLSGAFWPAISNKAGEGKVDDVRRLSFMTCRLGTVLILLFAIPLALEIREVLRIWLVSPPPFAAEVCVSILIFNVFERMTEGYWMSIMAFGKRVVIYSISVGMSGIIAIFLGWGLFAIGLGMWSVCIIIVFAQALTATIRVALGRWLIGYEPTYWLAHVFAPVTFISAICLFVGYIPQRFIAPSFWRIVLTTSVVESVFLPLAWFIVLEQSEREYLIAKFRRRKG